MSEQALIQQVQDLSLLVKKQSTLLTKTGEQVLSLQVQNQRKRVREYDPLRTSAKGASIDSSDFVSNEDLVQLVGELQGQLEVIEERSIRRLINSQKKSTERLAPILNHDGEEPDFKLYPDTEEELLKIDDLTLVKLARFYEVLPPTPEEQAKFKAYLESENPEPEAEEKEEEVDPKSYTEEQLIEAFDHLARFIGVRARRGTDTW